MSLLPSPLHSLLIHSLQNMPQTYSPTEAVLGLGETHRAGLVHLQELNLLEQAEHRREAMAQSSKKDEKENRECSADFLACYKYSVT